MLTTNEKEKIINSRGESDLVGKSSRAYNVIMTDGSCTVISLNESSVSDIVKSCKQRFGDRFIRIE